MPPPQAPVPASSVRILDGGLATELEARGHDLSDRLWSARMLLSDPDAIEAVHLAYFVAGAQVATTASYQATASGFAAVGLDGTTATRAIHRSVELARRARDRFSERMGRADGELFVAGSVGPYGAMLADGSEYRGDYDPGEAALRDLHAPRMEALIEAGVDLLAIETIPTVREAEILVRLVDELGVPAWLSYQCRDGATTAAGEPIGDAVAIAAGAQSVVAVGVNCTAPRHMPTLLAAARERTDRPLIAYPNGGDTWDPARRRWQATRRDGGYDARAVASWTALGASWLGGCCGTGPADIAALAVSIREDPVPARPR
jgi:homocysteine S-methyltransferase